MSVRLHRVAKLVTANGSGERPRLGLEDLESHTGRIYEKAKLSIAHGDAPGLAAVEPGDVLFGKLRPYLAKGWVADEKVYASTELLCMRPGPSLAPRWLGYVTMSQPFLQHAIMTSEGTKMPRTSWDAIGAFELTNLGKGQQRAIADYLDKETARIDALIAKKQLLIELLEKRRWQTFNHLLSEEEGGAEVPLRRVIAAITDGPFGSAFSSSDYSDDGIAVVRLGNIGFAEWRPDALAYLPLHRWPEFSRFRVRENDLLVAGLGDSNNHAGRACVAPAAGPMIVKGKCFCARIDHTMADPDYLAIYLSSPLGAERISIEARGSTRQMINLEIFKQTEVSLPQVDRQREIVTEIRAQWRDIDRIVQMTLNQIDLLAEHRQALITAAVTGELDTPAAA